MKNKLRTVHIEGTEYKYAISNNEVRVYQPGTKQILHRISNELGGPVEPGMVKKYIQDRL